MSVPGSQRPRIPVRALGKKTPESDGFMEQFMGHTMPSASGGLVLNPDAFKGAPPYVLELLNGMQNCLKEVHIMKMALMRRGILTEPELQEAAVLVDQATEEMFKSYLNVLERQINQAPNTPTDPRRNPT